MRLTQLVNKINCKDCTNDVFIFNDCRLQPEDEDKTILRNHNIIIKNDEKRERYAGGVAMAIPKKYFVTPIDTRNKESMICKIVIGNKNIFIGTQYVHPGDEIDDALITTLTNSAGDDNPAILLGDFNSSLRSFGSNFDSTSGEVLRILTESNDLSYVKNKIPTYINNKRGDDNVLDMCFVNKKANEILMEYSVDDPIGSDHLPITLHLRMRQRNEPVFIDIVNDEQLQENIDRLLHENPSILNLQQRFDAKMIDEEIVNFTKCIVEGKASATHKKRLRTNDGVVLSAETNALIAERRRLIKKRTRNRANFTSTERQRSNFLEREIKRQIKKDEEQHLKHKGTEILKESCPKKRWKRMNAIMNRNNKSASFKALTRNDGSKCQNRQENVETHANRLEQTCSLDDDPRIDNNFTEAVNNHLNNDYSDLGEPTICDNIDEIAFDDERTFMLTTEEETSNLIKAIKPTGAAGPDGIDHYLLKRFTKNAIKRLVIIFNACVATSYFPKSWKLSWVTMIPKPGKDSTKSGNYRPISLCATMGKILEKIYLKSFNRFLDEKNKRRPRQCGFAKGRSAQESVIKLADDISNAFKKGQHVIGVFIDLEKAFDKLWHNGVLYKLLKDEAPLPLIKIIASFLLNRTFQIKDGDILSSIRELGASAPQGGTSSPPIFTYYIADVPGSDTMDVICTRSDGSGYADDNAEWRAFLKTKTGLRIAEVEIQKYLDALQRWGSQWRMLPSPVKTEVMIFSDSKLNRNHETSLQLFGQQLRTVKEVCFLGVIFDQGLTWAKHINKLIQKATPRSIQIRRLAAALHGRDNGLVLQLVNSLIISLFDYSSVAWINAATCHWNKIHQCQMRTLKGILNVPRRTPDHAVFNIINTPSFKEIIQSRAVNRFCAMNNNNPNMTKFQTRCVTSNRNKFKSPFEKLTSLSGLDDRLTNTRCIICTYTPEGMTKPLPRPSTHKLCSSHRQTASL